jgi:hypothetical protein
VEWSGVEWSGVEWSGVVERAGSRQILYDMGGMGYEFSGDIMKKGGVEEWAEGCI